MNARAHDLQPLQRSAASPSQARQQAAPPASSSSQGVARVVGEAPAGWWLRMGEREVLAQRALSCLLAPAVGDRVWAVGEAGGEHFVLAVLAREGEAPAQLRVPGDLELRAEGRLRLRGDAGVELETSGRARLLADALEVQARDAQLRFVELRALAREAVGNFTRSTRIGQRLELLVDVVAQRSKSSYRAISELDHTQAETIDYRARGGAHIKAEHAIVNGKELVKVDGGQIHLG
ncbi:DUF3540 domain-containing protein [Pseudenhygromyxa sp. WMMC2535]|uniref:DUF3540 domain-containing protein n=1 Tax=Pseudenhygromyxa sp. WMMC2535 TaxID=2712867 RepID=UPI001596210C|nr:DUF3540 domain-containing protein [Pseudenhygromyxa sp. WMMC2535]NVB40146.1 DUF3540 domain-containing protein [Pseudenhygromyxa sp. WMMC2535]